MKETIEFEVTMEEVFDCLTSYQVIQMLKGKGLRVVGLINPKPIGTVTQWQDVHNSKWFIKQEIE